ncbi:hypothetical protein ACFL1A_01760 [Patescibacteria group bacterium]
MPNPFAKPAMFLFGCLLVIGAYSYNWLRQKSKAADILYAVVISAFTVLLIVMEIIFDTPKEFLFIVTGSLGLTLGWVGILMWEKSNPPKTDEELD